MSFIKKIQKMQQDGIISAEVAQKMIESENNKSQDILWKNLFRVAGVLIGLGILMVIGANLADLFNLFYALSYLALGACAFGLYKSITNNKRGLRELFAILSFILVGAILGLIRQKYQLAHTQFAIVFWCIISLPYILLSRSYVFNIIWLLLLNAGLPWEYLYETEFFQKISEWGEHIIEIWQAPVIISFISATISALLCLAGIKIYSLIKQKAILPNAFAIWMRFYMYITIIATGVVFSFGNWGFLLSDTAFLYNKIIAQISVIGFLAYRIWLANKNTNIPAIKRNVVFMELYVIYLFIIQLKDLFATGLGLIITGCILLGAIWLMRKIHSRFLKPLTSVKGQN